MMVSFSLGTYKVPNISRLARISGTDDYGHPFPLVVNQLARITIVGTNAGPTAFDNVTITSGMPNNIAIEAVNTSQGDVSVYNSAITVHAGHLDVGQSVTVYVDVTVVATYPSDAPFNVCAGLTYTNGVARLSCLPNQSAVPPGTRPRGDCRPTASARSMIPIGRRCFCRYPARHSMRRPRVGVERADVDRAEPPQAITATLSKQNGESLALRFR